MGKTWAEANCRPDIVPSSQAESRRLAEQGRAVNAFLYRFGRLLALQLLTPAGYWHDNAAGRWWQDCGGVAVELTAAVVAEDVLRLMGEDLERGRQSGFDRVLDERAAAVERVGVTREAMTDWLGYALERQDSPVWVSMRVEMGKASRRLASGLWLSMRAETG